MPGTMPEKIRPMMQLGKLKQMPQQAQPIANLSLKIVNIHTINKKLRMRKKKSLLGLD